ncbi:4Fe-4S binding protein, partial [Gordonibacter sp.]
LVPQVYVDLAQKIEKLGIGYPATEEGIEFPIIMSLFTPDEAQWFVDIPNDFNTAEEVANALGRPVRVVEMRLESMSHKGLLYREKRGDTTVYRTIPLVHGLYEFGIAQAEKGWMQYAQQYFILGGAGARAYETEISTWRTTPNINGLSASSQVLPIDDAEAIIRSKDRIVVAPCVCRTSSKLVQGVDCPHEFESCFAFDKFGDFYVENGMGRYVSADEGVAIMKKARDEGCIIQVANTSSQEQMCCCCTCCCGPLNVLKIFGGKAQENISNYYSVCDAEQCLGSCEGVCTASCPMAAISFEDDHIAIDLKKCIGCGLCAVACQQGAMALVQKAPEDIFIPEDETYFDNYLHVQRLRGIED